VFSAPSVVAAAPYLAGYASTVALAFSAAGAAYAASGSKCNLLPCANPKIANTNMRAMSLGLII
jgi:hypothetical protein